MNRIVFAQSFILSITLESKRTSFPNSEQQRFCERVLLPTRDRYLMCTRSVLFQIQKSRKVTDAVVTGKKLNHQLGRAVCFIQSDLLQIHEYTNCNRSWKSLTFCLLKVGKLYFDSGKYKVRS